MNQKQFTNALAKAQSLMLDEGFNARVEASARSYRGGGNSGGNLSSSELAMFERQAFGSSSVDKKPITLIESSDNQQPNFDKLPDAIRESFMKLPPQTGEENDNTTLGVATRALKRNVMTEQTTPQPMYMPSQGGIDYSLIKMIVNECVKNSLAEMKSSLLTESAAPTMRGFQIKDGNKIQFLDTKGNLYEGVLRLKKRAE